MAPSLETKNADYLLGFGRPRQSALPCLICRLAPGGDVYVDEGLPYVSSKDFCVRGLVLLQFEVEVQITERSGCAVRTTAELFDWMGGP